MGEDILHYFSQFGPVTDVKMMHNADGTSKGYCFVTFESAESAQAVYANYDHNMIDGKWVDCKPSDGGGTKPKPGDWWCPMCGDLVFASRSVCNMCGYNGGGGTQASVVRIGGGGSGSRVASKAGDWNCPACGDLVFASKSACSMCGTDKPDDGAGGYGRSMPMRPMIHSSPY